MKDMISYLKGEMLPKDKNAAQTLRIRATRYTLHGNILFKQGYTISLLRYITEDENLYVMKEINEAIYGIHSSGHPLKQKSLDRGILLTEYEEKLMNFARICNKCQTITSVLR